MRKRQDNFPENVDYGYVIIPTNVNRDDYVKSCLLNERISILGTNGNSIIHNCYISKNILREITFPEDDTILGDVVVYLNNSFKNKPFIIGILSKENDSQLLNEFEFRNRVDYINNVVDISGNAKDGKLSINVFSDKESEIEINVKGDNPKMNINVNGEIVIYGENNVEIQTVKNISLKKINELTPDKFSEIKMVDDLIQLIPMENGKIINNQGEEPLLLGNSTVKELKKELKVVSDIIDAFIKLIPSPTPANGVDPSWATVQQTLNKIKDRVDYSKIISKISFTS